MTGAPQTPAGWYADPYRRHQLRWWDGVQWTPQVADDGRHTMEEPEDFAIPVGDMTPDVVRGTVARAEQHGSMAGAPATGPAPTGVPPRPGGGSGSVFDQPILVVNQKAKLIELANEYAVYDQHGQQVAAVRQIGQTAAKKALRALTSFDQYMTHRLEVVDGAGTPLLRITRPGVVFKSRFQVEWGDGTPVGEIAQQNMIGKIRFGLSAGGHAIGALNAENWRAWNFAITDHTGAEVARITKTWEGMAKAMFTTADNYVVHIHRPLDEPLRSLVVASALSVDTALKQHSGAI